MAPRKRKSPDRKRPAKEPGLASRALFAAGGAAGGALLRHPKPVLGCAGFAVLFSFVAANALWYQHGGHPSPFLATRDPRDPTAIAGYRQARQAEPDDVTTFRIERAPVGGAAAGSASTSSSGQTVQQVIAQQQTSQQQAPASGPYAPVVPAAETAPVAAAGLTGRDLIAEIQRQLSRRGLYDGADDGLTGPKTQSAIMAFEQGQGLAARGEATPELLAALQARPQASAAAQNPDQQQNAALHVASIPTPVAAPRMVNAAARAPIRPEASLRADVTPVSLQPSRQRASAQGAAGKGDDPVAAAIRSSESRPYTVPPAEIPAARQMRASAQPAVAQAAARAPSLAPVHAQPMPQRQASAAGSNAADMVLQIQRGLANIAYADVQITGYTTPETREAILRFQRHYRLPETGEPNAAVLGKLKAIGAL